MPTEPASRPLSPRQNGHTQPKKGTAGPLG